MVRLQLLWFQLFLLIMAVSKNPFSFNFGSPIRINLLWFIVVVLVVALLFRNLGTYKLKELHSFEHLRLS